MNTSKLDKSHNNSKDLARGLKELALRVSKLEEAFKKTALMCKSDTNTNSVQKSLINPEKEYTNNANNLSVPSSIKPKYAGKKVASIQAVATETLDAGVGDKSYRINGEDVVQNQLVMGDDLLIEVEGDNVKSVKVARRFKRNEVEGLVTVKDDIFYAVSEYGVHKLINYDVKTKAVLKGFEVSLLLPKDKEPQAKVAIIKDVESSGNHVVSTGENLEENKTEPQSKPDPRVLGDDDLV